MIEALFSMVEATVGAMVEEPRQVGMRLLESATPRLFIRDDA